MDYYSLTDSHKKVAAIRSAAKHATNPNDAVMDYMSRTGMIDLAQDKSEGGGGRIRYDEAKKEMLSLLPAYRHPVNDVFAESMIFFDKKPIMTGQGYESPQWLEVLEKISSVPGPLLSQIRQYVRKAELTTIDLNIAEDNFLQSETLLDNAHDAYQPIKNKERPSLRAQRVVTTLGLTIGKRRKTHDPVVVYETYVKLVRHKGLYRHDATIEVANIFNLTEDTTLKSLHSICANIKKSWKQHSPREYDRTVKKYLKGLVKPRADWNL